VGSLEDIHANHSVAQGSEKAKKTQDTCGPISESMSGQLDLFGAFSKMSEVTPRWGYGESCPIWRRMVTERSGDCSARRKQARLTNASDASSWPTASARDHKGGYTGGRIRNGKVSMDTLDVAVQAHTDGGILSNWPTPRAGNPGSRKPGTGGKILAEEAKKSWSTPQSRDHLSAEPKEKWEARAKLQAEKGVNLHLPLNTQCHHIMEEQHAGPPAPEKSSTSGKNHGSWPTASARDWKDNGTTKPNSIGKTRGFSLGQKMVETSTPGKLNPNWVEQLMGLPVGWTQLPTAWTDSASLETALFPKPQK